MANISSKRWGVYSEIASIIPKSVFVQSLTLSFCLIFLYSPTILNLIHSWWKDYNYSHGFLVPLISLYLIWRRRDELQNIDSSPNCWGALFILFGGAILIFGKVGGVVFLMHISLIFVIVGLTLLLLGWHWLKALAFPIAYLTFIVPLPPTILNAIAYPLQLLAANFSNVFLQLFNVPVVVDKDFIFLPNITLFVAPGCAGIRYIIPVSAIAVVLAYLMLERWLHRAILVGSAIVMAVLTNLFRVASTALLSYFVSPKLTGGAFHSLYGWLISIVNLVFLWGMVSLLSKRRRTKDEFVEHYKGCVNCDSTLPTYPFPLIKYTKQFYIAVIILISLAVCFHVL